MKTPTFYVYAMKCNACGYCASAMTEESKLAAMMLHLIHRHGPHYEDTNA